MVTKLIQLADGTLIEAQAREDQAEQISGSLADLVDATFDRMKPILVRTCTPIVAAVKELQRDPSFSEGTDVSTVEIELGLSFEAEGNLYVTKSKATSNLNIKLTLKPSE